MTPTNDPWGTVDRAIAIVILIIVLLAFALIARADAATAVPVTISGTISVVSPTATAPWWYVAARLDTGRVWRLWTPFQVGQRVTVTGTPDAYGDIFGARIR